ncbi:MULTISPECIES: hypothetical protein [Methanosarcina]|uniref:Uncharacterized protein n=2 Tax=Methanosarcina barkeri TaxID=2208 RepID=A0A0E3QUD4_METBA|nr:MULTISPECIES: hypothetical protein [Methanosarcina]AKB54300.1 hypothetical protein MSBRM_1302 [Methanosarcina barkeri MS]AKB57622.1 hypothetical protein MSBR2_1106 [Methanosarcina barkeri 227]OEC92879.1 hypothetical protein A9239_17075 [Methanosarcina sp. A14]
MLERIKNNILEDIEEIFYFRCDSCQSSYKNALKILSVLKLSENHMEARITEARAREALNASAKITEIV